MPHCVFLKDRKKTDNFENAASRIQMSYSPKCTFVSRVIICQYNATTAKNLKVFICFIVNLVVNHATTNTKTKSCMKMLWIFFANCGIFYDIHCSLQFKEASIAQTDCNDWMKIQMPQISHSNNSCLRKKKAWVRVGLSNNTLARLKTCLVSPVVVLLYR